MRALVVLLASLMAFVPVASAHHNDTDLVAEFAPADPVTLYHNYLLIQSELQELQAKYPTHFKFKVIGHTTAGLEIYGGEITNLDSKDPPMDQRYRLYFDGSIHSNEQLGMETTMDIARWLLTEYETDPLAKWTVDNRRVFFVPLVNPDGNVKDSRKNLHEVDVNRNFPIGWKIGAQGASDDPTSGTYRGPAPASELETQAVMSFMGEANPHYVQSFHTGTVMLLFPYGNIKRSSPDHDMFTRICSELQDAMDSENGAEVPCGQIYTTIYPASGSTVDYAYGTFGSVAFTFEVDNEQGELFSLEPPEERVTEAWISIRHALQNVELYGARLGIPHVGVQLNEGKVSRLEVEIENIGYGNPASAVAHVGQSATAANAVSLDQLFEVAAFDYTRKGINHSVILKLDGLALEEGDSVPIELSYNKTQYRGFRENQPFTVNIVRQNGNLAASLAPGTGVPKVHLAKDTPGFELAITALACVALAGVVRARRRGA